MIRNASARLVNQRIELDVRRRHFSTRVERKEEERERTGKSVGRIQSLGDIRVSRGVRPRSDVRKSGGWVYAQGRESMVALNGMRV